MSPHTRNIPKKKENLVQYGFLLKTIFYTYKNLGTSWMHLKIYGLRGYSSSVQNLSLLYEKLFLFSSSV